MPPLTISPVLCSDLEDAHRFQLSLAAQEQPSIIGRLAFPNGASDISVAGYVERSRKRISDPTSTLRRVIARDAGDGDGNPGEVVGYALWSFVQSTQAEMEIETTDAGGLRGEWPGDVKREVLEAWINIRKKKREEVMQGKPHACKGRVVFFFSQFLESVGFLDHIAIHTLSGVGHFLKFHSSVFYS